MTMIYWNRRLEVTVSGKTFIYDDREKESIDIDIDIPFKSDKEPDVAEIRIYNLSSVSIGAIIENAEIIVNGGYNKNIGNLFSGRVESVDTKMQGVTKVTRILATDGGISRKNVTVSKTYKEGSTAKFIMQDIANALGYNVIEIQPVKNIVYNQGKVIFGNAYNELTKIVKESKSKMFINKGQLTIRSEDKGTETGFVLDKSSGMIGSPERIEEEKDGKKIVKYRIKSLLNHKIKKDSLIRVDSKTLKGDFRVLEGRHTPQFETEIIVKQ